MHGYPLVNGCGSIAAPVPDFRTTMPASHPPANDLRRAARYLMDAPVEFTGGSGVTRDLSTGGVFILCDKRMQVGSHISLAIILDDTLADVSVRMDRKGTIVRIEETGGQIGVAVKLDPPDILTSLH